MNPFKLSSALLSYPSVDLQDAIITDINKELKKWPKWFDLLSSLLQHLCATDLITLQENYVATFDRTPNHSLHLFEHLHGENRDRGEAMVNLLHEYQAQGFEPQGFELPDYLPLFLEFLSLQTEQQASQLLAEAIHVIAYIGENLSKNDSLYSSVIDLLIHLSPIEPQELKVAPIRDMDEALETFGPLMDGTEPLLNKKPSDIQIIQIQPRSKQLNV
ncbi:nitrate reductase molybdenum cofactor assembly chaperone [Acinetobacter sp. ANC 4558]|uniref:nitrate reductase molybdenum cofactor assembly chaperone n=1 Tax=Acinetobacter sp. ANC 4558 TaxID=1977876 RepID=UPI000A33AB10|nr:nitrate reductase molybdenum cofactor assembly chaperone [Acinetobacter sp. ANC 4558]OTG87059.1 nitrate reductase molybdenum cofactor assembly chaperone [Acinetobacter sp. ANC 4558]